MRRTLTGAVLFAVLTIALPPAGAADSDVLIRLDPTAVALERLITDEPTTLPSAEADLITNEIADRALPFPTGAAGPSWGHHRDPGHPAADFLPLPDRWRIGVPGNYIQNVRSPGRYLDPYNQNVLKGDYPFYEDEWFVVLTAISDTLFEYRKLPTPSGMSAAEPNRIDFFGFGDQYLAIQNLILSVEIFEGNAAYKPRDLELRLTPVFQFNYVDLE
ncbi:MAG: hypothetical protein NZ561_06605, partial [Phycisphaerae bacterium]|nr:hypothetical protein [Phycisphaerae bacterium]MDW8261326.1 hypothetical protein [Phycisphaerales bacterium]